MPQTIAPSRIETLDPLVAEILRGKTPAERVAMITSAHRLMCKLIEGPLRQKYPKWTDAQIRDEVARRLLLGSESRIAALNAV